MDQFLGRTSIPAHQGVGPLTFDINPIDSILVSSSLRWGIGTFLGVYSEYAAKVPGPLKREVNC